jgi:hypothetical protein
MSMNSATQTPSQIHPFELAGLGKAPFRFDGIEDTSIGAGPDGMVRTTIHEGPNAGLDVYTKPGGSCDLCGHYIVTFCWVRSADGKRFKVGTDCIAKLDKSVDDPRCLKAKVKRAAAKLATAKRNRAADQRIAKAIETMASSEVAAKLAVEPHPNEWRAEQGDTLADWCEWMLSHAGRAGKTKVARTIEKIAR